MSEEQRRVRMKPVLDRIPDHWGKYLPDAGWDEILLELDAELAKLDPGYEIQQAKEKFGTLRFYFSFSDETSSAWPARDDVRDAMYHLVNEAEAKSETICERCGQPGRPRSGGWIKTLCDEHATKKGS